MSWVAIIMDPNDNKVKVDKFYLKKIVLGTVQEDLFLIIFLEVVYKYNSYYYNISLLIRQSLSLRASLLFYTIFLISSLPSTCRSNCWC